MSFIHYPAIDVRDGRVVRLRQGDYAQETRYSLPPLEQARRYADAGASWLHLVDLDAAREGGYTLAPLLGELRSQTQLKVQTGGGIRDATAVAELLVGGAARVVVGTLAVREPAVVADWLQQFGPERLCLALDTRQAADGRWLLPVSGWTEGSGVDLLQQVGWFAERGLRHLLCTDIGRDGMLGGINVGLYRKLVAEFPDIAVQASGGVAGLEDIRSARAVGCAGVVLGKALLDGRFSLTEALTC